MNPTEQRRDSDDADQVTVTRIATVLSAPASHRAEELIPLVYDDLRRLARSRMAAQPPGQTLQATALVHEAFLRVEKSGSDGWDGRGHYFAAAAEAMRRIVIDGIRRKQARKHGGGQQRVEFDAVEIPAGVADDELLAVNEALDRFEEREPETAQLVKLRFFAGLTLVEAADALGLSERTARRRWNYARAWLYDEIQAS